QYSHYSHSDDLTAKRVVHAEVKHQLKQVRYKARNFLLTGIVNQGPILASEIRIPTIKVLSRLLWRHFMSSTGESNQE
ncbi:hypothetical protein VP01_9484g1, partial [Puccinia sorghi]